MKPLASRDTPSQQRGVLGVGTGVGVGFEPDLGLSFENAVPGSEGGGGIGMAWALMLTQLLGM